MVKKIISLEEVSVYKKENSLKSEEIKKENNFNLLILILAILVLFHMLLNPPMVTVVGNY